MVSSSRLVYVATFVASVVCSAVFFYGSSLNNDSLLTKPRTRRRHLTTKAYYCHCPRCTPNNLDAPISLGTCATRIHALRSTMSNLDACRQTADEFPSACGVCHPDHCRKSTADGTSESEKHSMNLSSASNFTAAAAPVTVAATTLLVKSRNGSSDIPLARCQGDCSNDSDCAAGLVCFQRCGNEDVPGCDGAAYYSGIDFCVAAINGSSSSATATYPLPYNLSLIANGGHPKWAFPLGKCQGDCDSDSDCQSGLSCLQRSAGQAVPGCTGSLSEDSWDYCVELIISKTSASFGRLPAPAIDESNGSSHPLGRCEGDCDADADCEEGLLCYHRNGGEPIPGCSGGTSDPSGTDFCISPYQRPSTPLNGVIRSTSGTVFALKLYWQQGYLWQEETFERKWCLRCQSNTLNCTAGPNYKVYLTNCEIDSMTTHWSVSYLTDANDSGPFHVTDSNSNLCLTVPSDTQAQLFMDHCASDNQHQHFYARNGAAAWGNHFELNPSSIPDGCVGTMHHPKFGERLYVYNCQDSRQWTTSAWTFY